MLDACPAVLKLSVVMALVPPVSLTLVIGLRFATLDITQPCVSAPKQSAVIPQKKKSVPVGPPVVMLGLKNSLMGEHREAVEGRIRAELEAAVFMIGGVPVLNPKVYRHGVKSAAPVPQTKI